MSDEAFPRPPRAFEDKEGREIEIRALGDDPDERAALVAMYDDYDPADRAQGIPPVGEGAVRDWLETLFDGESYNVVAWHGDEAVGHATLVAGGDRGYELAIFVYQPFQGAGIGTRLLKTLLGHGVANGVDTVWLTVERWNRSAIALYEKVGFVTESSESFELEMELDLD